MGTKQWILCCKSTVLQLDVCLTGLGGCWGNMVYHLPIPCRFKSLDIVHLEMPNILQEVKIFEPGLANEY